MKKAILLSFLLVLGTNIFAKSVAELWLLMPDSITTYINQEQRHEMTNLLTTGSGRMVNHLLQGQSKTDTLTADYMRITLSHSLQMELKKLPLQGKDSIVCMVKTWSGPERESEVSFYTQNWQILDLPNPLDQYREKPNLMRPDTMTEEKYKQLTQNIGFVLTAASLSASDYTLTLQQTVPLLPAEQSKQIEALLQPICLKWDGQHF